MTKLLLVEDEPNVAATLSDYLSHEGYAIDVAPSVATARDRIARDPELVLLDWRLPDGQGIELLREWRKAGRDVPVILITARADLVDKVLALEMGAGDYVTKPFDPRELLARIRARLREKRKEPVVPPRELAAGGVRIDLPAREASYRGVKIELTRMEFELLRALVEAPGTVFSREELLNRVWGYDSFPTTRTVDTHVLQLRQKLAPDLFETVRGIGYRFRPAIDEGFTAA